MVQAPRLPRLGAAYLGNARRPAVRLVHLGLGSFHRAHQAWYTAHADDAGEWGIASFSGRGAAGRGAGLARQLNAQDGLYTLVERGAAGDRAEVVTSIVAAHPGSDVAALADRLADPAVAAVTLTVTEAGYRLTPAGWPDLSDPAVRADLTALRDLAAEREPAARRDLRTRLAGPPGPVATRSVPGRPEEGVPARPTVRTALGRLLAGLAARWRAGGGPLAVVPCDNLPGNGPLVRTAVTALADEVSPVLRAWIEDAVSWVATSVDRITPRTGAGEIAQAGALTGWHDEVPVVTEPFTDWVLCGDFPAGRPRWETAGARFVDDIGPWERRKLWMLNGAHTLLSALGSLRGHRSVAEAIADPVCRAAVDSLWDADARHLPALDLDRYRAALATRFANPRIDHRLDQIAEDSLTKLRLRVVPVAHRELDVTGRADACATAVAAWVAYTIKIGADRAGPDGAGPAEVLARVDDRLAADAGFREAVDTTARRLLTGTEPPQ